MVTISNSLGTSLNKSGPNDPEGKSRTESPPLPLSGDSLTAPSASPQILLIDDDPVFGRIMSRIAEQSRVAMTYCRSLDELSGKSWWGYDAAIVDYDLGNSNGIELVQQLERHLGDLPVILVSQSHRVDVPISRWPSTIKGFMHKTLGHFAILEVALAAHDMKDAHRTGSGAATNHGENRAPRNSK